jgi:hypothetical protein
MPFKSEKQRRYLWAKEPQIAEKWTKEHGSKIVKKHGGVIKKGIGLRSRWLKEEK